MSEILDDTHHPVRFISPLGAELVVRSMTGDEALSSPFCYNLELLSHNPNISFSDIVGQQVTVVLALADGERHFNGYITEFRFLGASDRFYRYQATLRPWLWFLTRTSDCKIFQEKKVPDIIMDVFRDCGFSDFDDRLSGTYRDWEYCVQYRETDFNFISRLAEQEGIYYFFEHQEDKHVLVLVDDMNTHAAYPGFDSITYHSPGDGMSFDEDFLDHWAVTQSIQPEHYAIQDWDFTKPRTDLSAKLMQPGEHAYPLGNSEIYDYPGEYSEQSDGDSYVGIRLEELRSQMERVSAGGPCRGLSAGCKFTLQEYPRDDQNTDHLVIHVSHQISDTAYISSGAGSAEELYHCQVELMAILQSYRHVRSTPKPIVQGPQTAIVVGPRDEEIYTDEYGRVKVQFHWDRYGQRDENSSCWVRVSQYWAGNQWGSIHIPRIDQEVIVSFEEGDPDKPIITGRLYNAVNMPPYNLPDDKTQSGVKTRSTKDGSADNFNELRFEDKIGSEHISLHAEKDLNTMVENIETRVTSNSRGAEVGDRGNLRPAEVIETLQVFGGRVIDIRGDDGLTVSTGTHGRAVVIEDGDYALKVDKADYKLSVEMGDAQTNVKMGQYKLEVGMKDATTKVNLGNWKLKTAVGGINMESLAPTTIDAIGGIELTSGIATLKMNPGMIELKIGASSIMMTPGTIEIKAPAVTTTGIGMNTVTGAIVKINS